MSAELIEDFLQDSIDTFRRLDVWDEEPTLALLCTDTDGRMRGVLAFPTGIWAHGLHPRRVLRILERALDELGPPPPLSPEFTLEGLVGCTYRRFAAESQRTAELTGALDDGLRGVLRALRGDARPS